MKGFIIGIAILAIAGFLAEGVYSVMRKKRSDELTELLIRQSYVKFNELISASSTKAVLSQFNIFSFKITKAIQQKNPKDVTHVLFELSKSKVKPAQKGFLYEKAYFYFLSIKDYNKAGKIYDLMKELNRFVPSRQVEIMNDTFVKGGSLYLDELIRMFDLEENDRLKIEYAGIIAKMYENKKETANQKKYLELAKKLVEK